MATKLISEINGSGLYAQYAASALKDNNGNEITATYQTKADMENYPTSGVVGSAIGEAIADLSGTIVASAFATQTYVDTEIAKVGSYTTANGTGADLHPDVSTPSIKTIYLVKDTTATVDDKWKEWIYTSAEGPVTAWELIGDTSMNLNGYATETWVGNNYVSQASTAGWDVTPYTGNNGIGITNHEVTITANYLSANALDNIAAASGDWNSAAQAIETSGATWNTVTAKQDTLTFTYATIG